MKCGICEGDMQKKFVTYTQDVGEGVIVIRKVPAYVCSECGNVWYSGSVTAKLEKMVDDITTNHSPDVAIETYERAEAEAMAA
jgi:YgiT-type zinc finger domain-containing protein